MKTSQQGSFTQLKSFNFFVFGSFALLFPYLPLYFQQAGFSAVQIGLLMSVGPITSIVANPFWGYWSDRLQNTRLILLIMLSGNLILSQVFFQMHHFYAVFSIMLVFFFFQSALNTMSNSLILHAIEKTNLHFGSFRWWGSLGFAAIAIISSPIIQYLGVGNLGYVYAVFLIITIALTTKLPQQGRVAGKFSMKGFSHIVIQPFFLFFLLFSIFLSIPNQMNMTFMPLVLKEMGGSEIHIGWAWFIAAIIEIPVFILLDRFMRQKPSFMLAMLILVSTLYTIRWLFMIVATSPAHILINQFFHSVTFGTFFYVGTLLSAYLVPSQYRASGQAVYALTYVGVSGILAGLLGGWIYDSYGITLLYGISTFMAVTGLIGFSCMYLISRRKNVLLPTEQQAE